jgi:hypothetical protein
MKCFLVRARAGGLATLTTQRGNGPRKSFLVLGWKDVIIASIIKHRTQERHGNYCAETPFYFFFSRELFYCTTWNVGQKNSRFY